MLARRDDPGAAPVSWFDDARHPDRALKVRSRPDDGHLSLSLWQGDVCTGTFRLPRDQVAPLSHLLVDVLATDPPAAPDPTAAPDRPRGRGPLARLRHLVDRPLAEVVDLVTARRPDGPSSPPRS